MKKLEKLQNEDGVISLIIPTTILWLMMLFFMVWNLMYASGNRYHVQLMLDSASRAGSLAVKYSYGIKERNGHGLDNYHVYTELDEAQADQNALSVIEEYKNDMIGIHIDEVEMNPSGITSPIWNYRRFKYDEREISHKKQYKNGNFTVRVRGKVDCIGLEFLHLDKDIPIEMYSQSVAKGKVTGIH